MALRVIGWYICGKDTFARNERYLQLASPFQSSTYSIYTTCKSTCNWTANNKNLRQWITRLMIATLHVLNAKITQNLVCISINANLVDVTGDDICKVSNLFPKYLLSVSKFRGNPLGSVTETGNVWLRNLHHFSPQTRMVANQPCWIPAPKIITLSESKA